MNITLHIIAFTLAMAFILTLVSIFEFKPTRYWWSKKLGLYKISKRFENINSLPIREIEAMLEFLILDRCSEENRIIKEIRNGYILRYFPESVNPNKRWAESNYVEIYNKHIDVTLRVTFSANGEPKYQVERQQNNDNLESLFFYSEQGKMKDFLSRAYATDGRREILENYRDFVIRAVM